MIPKDGLGIQYFLAAFRRRFWYVVIPVFIVSLATLIYCIRAPRLYKSTSLILILPQEVPDNYVRSTVTSDITARLSSIQEEVLSRSKLEEIIQEHNLYPKIRAEGTVYDAAEKMREDIEIDIKESSRVRGRAAPSSFEISYSGKHRIKVRDVTAAIAKLFIDHNYRLRAEQAAGTLKFLDRELERMRDALRQKEELVREFKEKYFGLLPEQMENNYRILSQLQQQLDGLNTVLQQTEDRRILLQGQLGQLEAVETSQSGTATSSTGSRRPQSLEALRAELKALKSRYSDRHPDVIKVASTIAKMEEEQQANAEAGESSEAVSGQPSTDQTQPSMSVRRRNLVAELYMLDKELQSLRSDKEKTANDINEYRRRIEKGPMVEQMFVDLRRDYEQANENYQSLLDKKMQAEMAENLERTQKGEQFKILDAANLPQKPYKPDIFRILTMGLMIALGSGLGLAFLREYLDPTFWSRREVEIMLDLPVLASIPVITTEREQRWKRIKRAGAVCLLLVMSSTLVYALYVLWQKNPGFIPLPL